MKVTIKKLKEMIEYGEVSVVIGQGIECLAVESYIEATHQVITVPAQHLNPMLRPAPRVPLAIGGSVKLVDEEGTILVVER